MQIRIETKHRAGFRKMNHCNQSRHGTAFQIFILYRQRKRRACGGSQKRLACSPVRSPARPISKRYGACAARPSPRRRTKCAFIMWSRVHPTRIGRQNPSTYGESDMIYMMIHSQFHRIFVPPSDIALGARIKGQTESSCCYHSHRPAMISIL